jgi:TetR/AcrR family transcriptional repressor of nem operon
MLDFGLVSEGAIAYGVQAMRPKSFDPEQVLGRAMELFWLHGYAGIGVADLLRHMGISRQSLYDTFGSKRDLFIRVIEHYRATQLSQALGLLERPGPHLDNVRAVVRFFEDLAGDDRCRGCLVANALVELGPHDEEVAALLSETLGLLERGICESLQKAQAEGELPPGKSPVAVSRALTNAILGLAVSGKLPIRRDALSDIHAGTLAMLD